MLLDCAAPFSAVLAPDALTLAFVSTRRLEVWSVGDGDKGRRLWVGEGPTNSIRNLVFSADGKSVMGVVFLPAGGGASADHIVMLNTLTGKDQTTLPKEARNFHMLAVSPDGRLLAMASYAPRILLWDLNTNQEKLPISGGHPAGVQAVGFAADHRSLITSGTQGLEGMFKVWEFGKIGERSSVPEPGLMAPPIGLATNGKVILTRKGEAVIARDLITGEELGQLTRTRQVHPLANVSPDGKLVAIYGYGDTEVRICELPTLKLRSTLKDAPFMTVSCVAFSGDGATVATGEARGRVRLWDAATGKLRAFNHVVPGTGTALVALSRDGKLVAAANGDGNVRMWSADTGQERISHSFTGSRRYSAWLQFSPAGDILVASNLSQIRAWQTDSGKELPSPKGLADNQILGSVALAPNGRTLAAVDFRGKISIWDALTGEEVKSVQLGGGVNQLTFAADSRHLATANANGTAYIVRVPLLKP